MKTNKLLESIVRKFEVNLLVVILCSFVFVSCSDDEDDNIPGSSFDRKTMLEEVGTKLIIPNFEELQTSVDDLANATNVFIENTNEANLASLREKWIIAVKNHQHCSAFGFGPGELLLGSYASVLAVFPVNELKIEDNIVNPTFDLPNSFARDIRGFYTVEYLIYGKDQTNEVLIAGFDENRKAYLELVVNELKSSFETIVSEWKTSYIQEFIESDGTSAGSSISMYYNSFVRDYENLKNFKVELPAGLTAGQAAPDGSLVEAYYSGISSDLIYEHFESSKNIWLGQAKDGEEIIGFDEYLESVIGGPELVTQTKEALLSIDGAIANLPEGSLSENVSNPSLEILRDKLQANTANFKSSMSSLLGISITFNSGDGD